MSNPLDEITVEKKWVRDLLDAGGKVYAVGGAVRDRIMGMEPKDVDIVVSGLHIETITSLLSDHGSIKEVGAKFGVLKFAPEGWGFPEDIDVALPRKEVSTGPGHADFKVEVSPDFTIEDDLVRRDISFNSMAIPIGTEKPELVDPHGGVSDMKNEKIRTIERSAFSEDPLRMLRVFRFVSSTGYSVEWLTFNLIQANSERVRDVSRERVCEELVKTWYKRKDAETLQKSVSYLFDTGVHESYFGFKKQTPDVSKCETAFDFFYCMVSGSDEVVNSLDRYLKGFKEAGGVKRCVKALDLAEKTRVDSKKDRRARAAKIRSICPNVENSGLLDQSVKDDVREVVDEYPLSINDLYVTGEEISELGFSGEDIGAAKKFLLDAVYSDEVCNTTSELIRYLNDNESLIKTS